MLLSIDLGEINGPLSFKSTSEAQEWLQNERNYWAWLGECAKQDNNIRPVWDHLNNIWNQLNQHISSVIQNENNDNFQNQLNRLTSNLQSNYQSTTCLLSAAPRAKFIDELKESDRLVAAYALSFFLQRGIPQNVPKALEGAFVGLQFIKGIKSNIEEEKKSLAELKTKTQREIDEYQTYLESLKEQFDQTKEKFENYYKQQEADFENLTSESKTTLQDIEHTYDEKLALQSSVKYWQYKQESHKKWSIIFGITSGLTIVALGFVLIYGAHDLIVEAEKVPYWKLAVLGVVAVLGVWVIRIIVRIFLSNLHLNTDASERVTMIKTYLAMLREGTGPKDEERQLILQTLFRPSPTGIVKDDGIPPSVLDMVTKLGAAR